MRLALALMLSLQALTLHAQGVELARLQVARNGDGLELEAAVRFDLPAAVQDALSKGLPIIFVETAEVYRERWYWLDKRVAGAQRQLRLVFQPLSRRWRLTVGGDADPSLALAQSFDSLEEATRVIRHVYGWRVADLGELEPGARYRVDFQFRLDLAQLPRPLQIGAMGESDWALSVSGSRRLQPESLK